MFGVPIGGEVIHSSHRSSLYDFEQATEMSPELLAVILIIEIWVTEQWFFLIIWLFFFVWHWPSRRLWTISWILLDTLSRRIQFPLSQFFCINCCIHSSPFSASEATSHCSCFLRGSHPTAVLQRDRGWSRLSSLCQGEAFGCFRYQSFLLREDSGPSCADASWMALFCGKPVLVEDRDV